MVLGKKHVSLGRPVFRAMRCFISVQFNSVSLDLSVSVQFSEMVYLSVLTIMLLNKSYVA